MADPSICPSTRLRCGHVEICWLMFCAKSPPNNRRRPMRERDLSKAELYRLTMHEQRASSAAPNHPLDPAKRSAP